MSRYREFGKLDDPVVREGDPAFVGWNTFDEAASLPPGIVQQADNVRMNGDRIEIRKGLDFLAGTVTLSYSAGTEQVFASGTYSDPDDSNENWLVAVTRTKAIIWNASTPNGLNVNYDTGTSPTVTTAHNAMVVQAFNQVYIFRLGARPLVWDGNVAATGSTVNTEFEVLSASASGSGDPLPSSDFGIYFRNRMIVSQPSTVATPTTGKTGAQTIVMSDLLTPNNVTSADSEFYLNFGSADWFVGATGYQDNQLLCFLRHSIHLISNVQATAGSGHFEVTRQHGCVARGTIAQAGPYTYFLGGDGGVYVVAPGVDPAKGLGIAISKVQGEVLPLSRPITSEFENLNMTESVISKSTAVFFDNKYFIAVALGSDTSPTTIYCYDALLSAWVSKDTFPSGFTIESFVKMPYGSNPTETRLFAVGPTGWYMMEQNAGLDDSGREIGSNSESGTQQIAGKFKTRDYTMNELGVKRWSQGQLAVETVASDAFNVKVNTIDPDSTTTALTYTASGTEEALLRFGARQRGYGANVEVTVTAGSPKFRHVALDASAALRQRVEVA
jgi:hypothetical protein